MNRLDLNLLTVLDALLAERSVTRAASRLGVSQPSVSVSLGRLRRHFGDELLYRSGNSYDLTPLAVALSARTGSALDNVERVFALQSAFDPLTSRREFTIVCSDYGGATVGAPLAAALATRAPGMRLVLRQSDPSIFADAAERLRTIDALVLPHGFVHGLPHLDLFEDEWMCVVSADNDRVGDTLTLADVGRLPWAVMLRRLPFRTSVQELARQGIELNLQVIVPTFGMLPLMVAGTDRVALAPRRMIETAFPPGMLRMLPCPLVTEPLVQALWWHPDYERDLEHGWVRQVLVESL